MPSRRLIPVLVVLVACGGAIGLVYSLSRGTEPERPRIRRVVLLTIDTLRADVLPMYGGQRVAAPALTALADGAVVFDQAQVPSSWTIPSTTSILTGLPPEVHGLVRPPVDGTSVFTDGVRPLADLMWHGGYHTAAIGYNPFLANTTNLRRGFREYHFFPEVEGGQRKPDGVRHGDATEHVTKLSRQWLKDHAKQDFFLWLHYYDPHNPYMPPQRFYRKPPNEEVPDDPDDYHDFLVRLNGSLEATLILNRGRVLNDIRAEANRLLAKHALLCLSVYEAETRFVDEAIGNVVKTLKELGIYDETLIVVTSDHGEEFWDHDLLEHGHSLYQEQLRVPLIIRPPGGGAMTARVDDRVSIMSILPTILDLCGLDVPEGQGAAPSLAAWVRGGEKPRAMEEFVAGSMLYGEPQTSIIFDEKKFIFREKSGREEYYDLRTDPLEKKSLAKNSPALVAEAKRRLEDYKNFASRLKRLLNIKDTKGGEPSKQLRDLLRRHGYLR